MPTSQSNRPIVAISMGDPSGIGPEIVLKALAMPSISRLASYIIVGDTRVLKKTVAILSRYKKLYPVRDTKDTNGEGKISNGVYLKKSTAFKRPITVKKLVPAGSINILDLHNVSMSSFSFGRIRSSYGKASIEYIRRTYGLVRANIADGMVTAPINKSSVKKAHFKFPGHTEYLAHLSGTKRFAMMLTGGPLRISLVTRHIPIREVSKSLTSANVADTIKLTLNTLKTDFNIPKPKIGICALNPHGGERGMFGNEEEKIILPALRKFRKIGVRGPIPADALFYDAYRGDFDGLVCLYHDQGLIPLKMVARDEGVNITLGLGFVRTSPDHGTAFDIAGKAKADSHSMEMAIRTAVSMIVNRKRNALQKRN